MTARNLIALAALYVAAFGLPDFDLPSIKPAGPSIPAIKEPSEAMQRTVNDIATICRTMDPFDRLVWMATWEDAATVVAGEDDDMQITFPNTLGLRIFTSSAFRVAWSRLANASGKYPGLDAAVEKAFTDTIGNEVKPWDDEVQEDAVELFEALAWAGAKGE